MFEGIIGYEDTVIPQLIHAISEHNINLLGLRGQAKTRIARSLTDLLDEYIPIVDGSEINDDPLDPLIMPKKCSKKTEIIPQYLGAQIGALFRKTSHSRCNGCRFIGDVDPIKAANLKLSYADERVIHFGMIPNQSLYICDQRTSRFTGQIQVFI